MSLPLSQLDALEPMRRLVSEGDDARSVGEAMLAVLLFLIIMGFLAWAGVADASAPGLPSSTASPPARTG
jgi:hypothetical protein